MVPTTTTTETRVNPHSIRMPNELLPMMIGKRMPFVTIVVNEGILNLIVTSYDMIITLQTSRVEPMASMRRTKGNYRSQLKWLS